MLSGRRFPTHQLVESFVPIRPPLLLAKPLDTLGVENGKIEDQT